MPGADLSYLFQNQPPAGMMAGWGQGRADAQAESELEKAMVANQQSKFNLDRSKQMLPGELSKLNADARLAQHNVSPDMLKADLTQKQGMANQAKAKGEIDISAVPIEQQKQMISMWKQQMSHLYDQAIAMGSQGQGGDSAMAYLDELMAKQPPDKQAQWENHRSWLSSLSPQQLVQEATKAKQALFATSDEAMLQEMKNKSAEKIAGISANARSQGDGKEQKYSIEQKITQYTEMLTAMKPGDPRRKTIEDAIKYLVSQKQSMGAYDQSYDLRTGDVRKRAPGSEVGTQPSAPKKWNPQTKKWE